MSSQKETKNWEWLFLVYSIWHSPTGALMDGDDLEGLFRPDVLDSAFVNGLLSDDWKKGSGSLSIYQTLAPMFDHVSKVWEWP